MAQIGAAIATITSTVFQVSGREFAIAVVGSVVAGFVSWVVGAFGVLVRWLLWPFPQLQGMTMAQRVGLCLALFAGAILLGRAVRFLNVRFLPERMRTLTARTAGLRKTLLIIPLVLAIIPFMVGVPSLPGLVRQFLSCEPPQELVVATTPESEPHVRSAAAAFTREQAEEQDCRPYNVSVYAIERAKDAWDGLAGRWDRDMGPVPHVWIPDSSVEAQMVQGRLNGRQGEAVKLDTLGSTRVTPLVAALPREVAERRVGKEATNRAARGYEAALEGSKDGRFPVSRADPNSSAAALLHTLKLYRDRGALNQNGQLTSSDAAKKVERELSSDLAARSETELLCGASSGDPDDDTPAVLTSEAALYRVRTGEACPEGQMGKGPPDLVPLYSEALPYLDHPFVRVRTTVGSRGDGADEAADRFHGFLDDLSTGAAAFSETAGTPTTGGQYLGYRNRRAQSGELDSYPYASGEITLLEQDPAAWTGHATTVLRRIDDIHGAASVLLAVDTSSSMAMPTRKFTAARDAARAATAASGSRDRLALWTFPDGSSPTATGHKKPVDLGAGRGHADAARDELDRIAPRHTATPLLDVVADGAVAIDREWGGGGKPTPMLVVLTDGVVEPDAPGVGMDQVRDRLSDISVRVRILAVGGSDACEVGSLPELDRLDDVRCVSVGDDTHGRAGREALAAARAG